MAIGIGGLIGRAASGLFSLFGNMRRRRNAKRWVGQWEAYDVVGRDLAGSMKGAGPTTVYLPGWWRFSATLAFDCYECDPQGKPTRYQKGSMRLDPDDPDAARRIGRYLDSAEVYEQRLRMLDNDTILIIPVPEGSTLGDDYRKHGWRRKR